MYFLKENDKKILKEMGYHRNKCHKGMNFIGLKGETMIFGNVGVNL